MKRIALIAALAATSAGAQQVVEFNGYSVRMVISAIIDGSTGQPIIPDRITTRAGEICASVEKAAEMGSQRRLPSGDVELLYLCM